MIINRRDSIPIDKIYAVEKKKWGTVWVRYTNEKGVHLVAVTRDQFRDFCMKLQMQRACNRTTTKLEMRNESND